MREDNWFCSFWDTQDCPRTSRIIPTRPRLNNSVYAFLLLVSLDFLMHDVSVLSCVKPPLLSFCLEIQGLCEILHRAVHSGKQITIFNFLFFIFASILPFIFSTRVFAIARPRPVDFLAVSTV